MWRSWRAAYVGWSMMVSSDTDLFGSVAFCGTVTMGQYDQDGPMMANGFWMVLVWQTSIKLETPGSWGLGPSAEWDAPDTRRSRQVAQFFFWRADNCFGNFKACLSLWHWVEQIDQDTQGISMGSESNSTEFIHYSYRSLSLSLYIWVNYNDLTVLPHYNHS